MAAQGRARPGRGRASSLEVTQFLALGESPVGESVCQVCWLRLSHHQRPPTEVAPLLGAKPRAESGGVSAPIGRGADGQKQGPAASASAEDESRVVGQARPGLLHEVEPSFSGNSKAGADTGMEAGPEVWKARAGMGTSREAEDFRVTQPVPPWVSVIPKPSPSQPPRCSWCLGRSAGKGLGPGAPVLTSPWVSAGVQLRGRLAVRQRGPADPRGLGLHEGLPVRAHAAGLPHPAHL